MHNYDKYIYKYFLITNTQYKFIIKVYYLINKFVLINIT